MKSSTYNGKRSYKPDSKLFAHTHSSVGFRTLFKNRNNHQNNFSHSEFIQTEGDQAKVTEFKLPLASSRSTVRSNQSNAFSQRSNKQNNLTQNSKVLSFRSMASSQSKMTSRRQSKRMDPLLFSKVKKIDDLEKKVQNILEQKLCFEKSKTRTKLQSNCNEFFTKQFQELTQQVKRFKTGFEGEKMLQEQQENEEIIEQLGKKIQIIEKIIAENCAESELLKSNFQNSTNIRKSLGSNPSNNKIFQKSTELMRNRPSISPLKEKNNSIYMQSTNQKFYQIPTKRAYKKSYISKDRYTINRQPLPKTSYSRDFLFYGSLPRYEIGRKEILIENNPTTFKKQTNYEIEFQSKKGGKANQKDLDCKKDKFKQLKISYVPQKVKVNEFKQCFMKQAEINKKIANYTKQNNDRRIIVSKFVNKTECCREYSGKKLNISNPIKNKKLNQFKNNFKSTLYA